MKRKILIGLGIMTMLLSACGKKTPEEVVETSENPPAAIESILSEDTFSDVTNVTEQGSENTSETADTTDTTETVAVTDGTKYVIDKEVICSDNETFTNSFEDGAEYSLDEIAAVANAAYPEKGYQLTSQDDISYQDIDCGSDGVNEQLIVISYKDSEGSYSYSNYLVVKEVDGARNICYLADTDIDGDIMVEYNGMISFNHRDDEFVSRHENSFVDADGQWHFIYGKAWYRSLYSYIEVEKSDELDAIHVDEYYFSPEKNKEDTYCVYYKVDENSKEVDDPSIYEDGSVYKKVFDDAGIDTYTSKDLYEKITAREKELGITE